MAGISKTLAIGNFWNRLVLSRATAGSGGGGLTAFRRNTHEIVYEKNVEDQLNTTFFPEETIMPDTEKYWAPNPKTGVFGPEPGSKPAGSVGSSAAATNQGSVMGETAWFRPTSLEDLDKSP